MIVLTGATGFLGFHLAKALKEQGRNFRCIVRSSSPRRARLEALSCDIREVDFDDPKSIARSLEGCETLVHALGLINGNEEALKKANVEYTRNVVQACKESKVRRFVYVSSVAAQRRYGPYGQTKFEGEEIVRKSGLPYLSIRPAFIYGEGDDDKTGLLIRTIKWLPIIPLPGGDFKIQPVYIDDVVSVLIRAIDDERVGRYYNVAGPAQIPLRDMITLIARKLGLKRFFIPIPLKLVQGVVSIYIRFFKNTRLPVKQILELDKHEAFDISETKRDLGFNPVDFEEGQKRMFDARQCVA